VNKHAGEQYHQIYHHVYGLRTVSLRVNNTYGPRHQMKHSKYGILNWMIRLSIDGGKIPIYGNGGQLRDFNYVDDVTEAFLLTGSNSKTDGQVYNLGSGNPISFKQIMEKVVHIAGSGEIQFVPWPNDRKRIETGDYVADFSKINKDLGWEPKMPFDKGLEKTITYYRKYKNHYW
jgi:UDP-glucose 4-epimerase